jgi:hypothetical protein
MEYTLRSEQIQVGAETVIRIRIRFSVIILQEPVPKRPDLTFVQLLEKAEEMTFADKMLVDNRRDGEHTEHGSQKKKIPFLVEGRDPVKDKDPAGDQGQFGGDQDRLDLSLTLQTPNEPIYACGVKGFGFRAQSLL